MPSPSHRRDRGQVLREFRGETSRQCLVEKRLPRRVRLPSREARGNHGGEPGLDQQGTELRSKLEQAEQPRVMPMKNGHGIAASALPGPESCQGPLEPDRARVDTIAKCENSRAWSGHNLQYEPAGSEVGIFEVHPAGRKGELRGVRRAWVIQRRVGARVAGLYRWTHVGRGTACAGAAAPQRRSRSGGAPTAPARHRF